MSESEEYLADISRYKATSNIHYKETVERVLITTTITVVRSPSWAPAVRKY